MPSLQLTTSTGRGLALLACLAVSGVPASPASAASLKGTVTVEQVNTEESDPNDWTRPADANGDYFRSRQLTINSSNVSYEFDKPNLTVNANAVSGVAVLRQTAHTETDAKDKACEGGGTTTQVTRQDWEATAQKVTKEVYATATFGADRSKLFVEQPVLMPLQVDLKVPGIKLLQGKKIGAASTTRSDCGGPTKTVPDVIDGDAWLSSDDVSVQAGPIPLKYNSADRQGFDGELTVEGSQSFSDNLPGGLLRSTRKSKTTVRWTLHVTGLPVASLKPSSPRVLRGETVTLGTAGTKAKPGMDAKWRIVPDPSCWQSPKQGVELRNDVAEMVKALLSKEFDAEIEGGAVKPIETTVLCSFDAYLLLVDGQFASAAHTRIDVKPREGWQTELTSVKASASETQAFTQGKDLQVGKLGMVAAFGQTMHASCVHAAGTTGATAAPDVCGRYLRDSDGEITGAEIGRIVELKTIPDNAVLLPGPDGSPISALPPQTVPDGIRFEVGGTGPIFNGFWYVKSFKLNVARVSFANDKVMSSAPDGLLHWNPARRKTLGRMKHCTERHEALHTEWLNMKLADSRSATEVAADIPFDPGPIVESLIAYSAENLFEQISLVISDAENRAMLSANSVDHKWLKDQLRRDAKCNCTATLAFPPSGLTHKFASLAEIGDDTSAGPRMPQSNAGTDAGSTPADGTLPDCEN